MTTSPFGTPNPFASPQGQAGEPAQGPAVPEVGSSSARTPILIGLVGVAAVAAVGTGLYFFTQSGDTSNETELAQPASPGGVSTPAATPSPDSTPLPTLTQFNGRNPFAAQVVVGGADAAPASTPVATTAPVSGGSSAYTGGGGTGSVAGTPGRDGRPGATGATGSQGPAGPQGPAGETPQFATVTLVGGDAVTGEADFTLRSNTEQVDIADLPVGDFLGTTEPGSWIAYTVKGADADADGVLDSVTIQMGDAVYTVTLGETVLLWQYSG